MAVRKDEVQISIAFLTDESKAYAKLIQDNQEFIRDLQKARKAGEDLGGTVKKIADSGAAASKIDLSQLAPAQLVTRARQIAQAIQLIPQSAPEYKLLEAEQRRINDQLATMRARTRGVSEAMTEARTETSRWRQVLDIAGGFGLFSVVQEGISGLINFGREALRAVDEAAKADAQVKATLKSTAESAGRSFEQLKAQADELEKTTLFSAEQTQGAQALLLTFQQIKGEVLDETIPLVQDLSTAFGQDLSTSAIQVGKALNDPIQGVTALRRVGISFSEDQLTLIKTLQRTGDVAGAQRIILKELETQVGGSAKAAAEAGLGPYQILQTRLGEISESFGRLIQRGAGPLAPVLRTITEFLIQLTESITTGEKATGKYAAAINYVGTILKAQVRFWQFFWEVGKLVYEDFIQPIANFYIDTFIPALIQGGRRVAEFVERAKELPVIGFFFRRIGDAVEAFKQLWESVPATFAGFRAAAQQAVTNVVEYFESLVRSAKIVAKEIDLALSIRSGTRERLQAEIAELKQQEVAAKAAGKTVGEAYTQARNAALAASRAEAEREARETERRAAAAAAQEVEGGGAGQTLQEARKKQLEKRLTDLEAGFLKEELVADRALLRKEISEGEHAKRVLLLKQRYYQDQLAAFDQFKEAESKAALDAERKLLDIQTQLQRPGGVAPLSPLSTTGPKPVQSQVGAALKNAELSSADEQVKIVQEKTQTILGLEANSELLRLELLRNSLNTKLQVLRDAGLAETAEFTATLKQKEQADSDYQKTLVENEQRTADLKKAIQEQGVAAAGDLFGAFADLLGQDEAARKKNAGAIKAFQTAQVVVQGVSEVQKIWAGAAELGPIAGPIIGAIQTAVAVARTAIAINKINAAKFAGGGYTGIGLGMPDHTGHRPVGVVHEREWVGPRWMVESPQYAPTFQFLESIRQRGFAQGGHSTTPAPAVSGVPLTGANSEMMAAFAMMSDEVRGMRDDLRTWRGRLKADVVYTDIEDAGAELATVRDDAGI